MTIAPVLPAPNPAPAPGPTAGAGEGGEFAALVAQHLAVHDGAGGGGRSGLTSDGGAVLLEDTNVEDAAGETSEAAGTPLLGVPAASELLDGTPVVAGPLVAVSAVSTSSPTSMAGTPNGVMLQAAPSAQAAGVPADAGLAQVAMGATSAAAAAPAAPIHTAPGPLDITGASTQQEAAGHPAAPVPTAAAQAGSAEAVAGVATAEPSTGVPTSPVPPGSAPTTAASAPAAPQAAPGASVASQVHAVIPALVTRGDGLHTLTLRLNPAELGEVRVTVRIRNGAVDVTLAAGTDARHALRQGAGELRSLLELVGAATGQVAIRDLPSDTSNTSDRSFDPMADDGRSGSGAQDEERAGGGSAARPEPQHVRTYPQPGPPPGVSTDQPSAAGSPTALDLRM